MRNFILDSLFAPLDNLAGIGQQTAKLLTLLIAKYNGKSDARIVDFLHFMPRNYVDRSFEIPIKDAIENKICTLALVVQQTNWAPENKKFIPHRIICSDGTGSLTLIYFTPNVKWLRQQFYPGRKIIISGTITLYRGELTMSHPDYVLDIAEKDRLPVIEPIYPLTAGLSNKTLQKAMGQALAKIPALDEWIDPSIKLPAYKEALIQIHKPATSQLLDQYRQRLAYDELLAHQLALRLLRSQYTTKFPPYWRINKDSPVGLKAKLPFRLTKDQEACLLDILQDLSMPKPMTRLLQGDVGCGKTIVATLAMAHIANAGLQAALMVPTEILARQHFNYINNLLQPLGMQTILLTGREKKAEKQKKLHDLATGKAAICIATHAILQPNVSFKNLSFSVIDEQHRFGVEQRMQLLAKSHIPNLLIMTATPIPRTLVLTAFGDIDVSKIVEKPANRQIITTVKLSSDKLSNLLSRIEVALQKGEKIYWICPLIEETASSDLISATARFENLLQRFGSKVALLHGKTPPQDKETIMSSFATGETQLLVATTVIEVGIDIKDASIIIIEHADRFGLAQLHQLRGRVGRSDKKSSCVLLYRPPISAIAIKRLDIMVETNDGFFIAEQDLTLRGEGEIFGTKQSGLPSFLIANLATDAKLLQMARDQIAKISLEEIRAKASHPLNNLLHLYHLEKALKTIQP
ncbi:ATP-dependent DNA helicase RecG [Bartonella sp. TP]|uniref:ATP-dependent DNA helicase RecG n=1 Tax=Bartonella sp. TP TaxID=3057550 RepID=UPI0025AF3921|nr:ATP-dependent DNA helicase RecG [Bartonella sp. TP]WJW80059.1 ATP-dependent DNA helicase RecG [Bartonella sp. TP]